MSGCRLCPRSQERETCWSLEEQRVHRNRELFGGGLRGWRFFESVTVTVNVAPEPVGLPEIAPVELFSDNPAGKLSVVTAQL